MKFLRFASSDYTKTTADPHRVIKAYLAVAQDSNLKGNARGSTMAAMKLLIGDLKLHHPTELTITSNHYCPFCKCVFPNGTMLYPASASLDLHYHSSNVNDDITRQLASLHHPNSAAECKRCFKVSFPHARLQVTSLPHTLIINYTNPKPWATRSPLTDVITEVDPPPEVLPSQALAPETK